MTTYTTVQKFGVYDFWNVSNAHHAALIWSKIQ